MDANIAKSYQVEVNYIHKIDSPNFLRQRAFDELGMVELITSLLNEIQKKDKVLKKIESKSS